VDIGLAILRVIVGLAFMTIFENFLPRNGVWGPQPWFVDDLAATGFPVPVLFGWLAVLPGFFGGLLLILGLASRPAAPLNAIVTFVAAFAHHKADIGQSGLTALNFLTMCTTAHDRAAWTLGPGRAAEQVVLEAASASGHSPEAYSWA